MSSQRRLEPAVATDVRRSAGSERGSLGDARWVAQHALRRDQDEDVTRRNDSAAAQSLEQGAVEEDAENDLSDGPTANEHAHRLAGRTLRRRPGGREKARLGIGATQPSKRRRVTAGEGTLHAPGTCQRQGALAGNTLHVGVLGDDVP